MRISKRPRPVANDRAAACCQRLITVSPRSARNEVSVQVNGAINVRVTAPPADGAANEAVVKVLADALSLPRTRIEIVRGATSRQKLVRFEMPEADLVPRLIALAGAVDTPTS